MGHDRVSGEIPIWRTIPEFTPFAEERHTMVNQAQRSVISLPKMADIVDRPRVNKLLEAALQKPLTTVVAGAGYGKTPAVLSVLESIACKHIWMEMSELDNMPARLWRRLVFAMAPYSQSLAMRLNALGYPDAPASFDQFLRLAGEAIEENGRLILVLDDFHAIESEEVRCFFERLIAAGLPNLSIVLISREKPRMSLAVMLSRGLMARVTEEDLRFTEDEMEAYYQMQGHTLDADMISRLYAYTEGWILAIYLIGLSLQRKNGVYQNPIPKARLDIFQLIEEEIFRAASAQLQKVLIAVSLLEDMKAGLLRELAGEEALAEISALSLLVRYDSQSDCYHMHNLFRAFLSEKRDMLSSDAVARTHLIAAQWYHTHNQPGDAIAHYRECGRYEEIFDIILSYHDHITRAVADAFVVLIEQAPGDIVRARPVVRVAKALYLLHNNHIAQALDTLSLVREEYEALPREAANLAVLGEAYIVLALICVLVRDTEFITLFQKADKCLPEGSALIDNGFSITEGIHIIGITKPVPGELGRYRDALFEAAPYAARVMNGCGYGIEYLNAADASLMTGDIRNAEQYAYEAFYRAQQQNQCAIECMASFYLVRIAIHKGDCAKIALIFDQWKERKQGEPSAGCMMMYDLMESWFYIKIGQPDKAAQWIVRGEGARQALVPAFQGMEYPVRSDWFLAEGKEMELLAFIKQTDALYEERGMLYARIQNRITESIVYHYLGEHKASMDALQAAYDLSSANDLVAPFVEYGSKMRTVLQAAMQDVGSTVQKAWLDKCQTKSSTYAKRISHIMTCFNKETTGKKENRIHLTKRELEVLSCLSQGLTRDEIADACDVSLNTVKSTLRSIFNKLGAFSSLEAVQIATSMNLV